MVSKLNSSKNIYFASDFHLGSPNYEKSLEREKEIVSWLDLIKEKAEEIFLVGDVFDFWFEYKHAIPKGFVRLQGKIAELTDSGIKVHFFKGNHDMWIFDYLPKELGIELHSDLIERDFFGKKYLIGHGDGFGPGDYKYKFIKSVFRNRISQWFFARLHPNFGIGLANFSSKSSRASTGMNDFVFSGIESERLYHFCADYLKTQEMDYFVFGHRHLPLNIFLNESSRYINLGEWLYSQTFLEVTPETVTLLQYKNGIISEFVPSNEKEV